MSSSTRAPTENQLSPLHGPHVLITSHNTEGKAVIKETEPVKVCHLCFSPPSFSLSLSLSLNSFPENVRLHDVPVISG